MEHRSMANAEGRKTEEEADLRSEEKILCSGRVILTK